MHIRGCYGLSEGSITISLLFLLFSTTDPHGFIVFTLIHQEKEYSTFLSDIRADNVRVRVCVYLCSVVRLISMFVDVYFCGDLFSETCFEISKLIFKNGSLRSFSSTYSVIFFITHCFPDIFTMIVRFGCLTGV